MIATDGRPTVADPVDRSGPTPAPGVETVKRSVPETAASYRPTHQGYPDALPKWGGSE